MTSMLISSHAMDLSAPEALFVPDGELLIPTRAAVGPWHERSLHGGVVGALLAGRLASPGRAISRITIELLAPAMMAPLRLSVSEPSGGARVQRQEAALSCEGRTVATARALTVRRAELDLPPAAVSHESPFDPALAPALDKPDRAASGAVGWDWLFSLAAATEPAPVPPGTAGTRLWMRVLLPVVAGTEISALETAIIAADTAQTGVGSRVPFLDWTFLNAELTVHFAREPSGPWAAISADGILGPAGAGIAAAELYDAEGRFGRSSASVVLERRTAR
jgi:hypothetical protein